MKKIAALVGAFVLAFLIDFYGFLTNGLKILTCTEIPGCRNDVLRDWAFKVFSFPISVFWNREIAEFLSQWVWAPALLNATCWGVGLTLVIKFALRPRQKP